MIDSTLAVVCGLIGGQGSRTHDVTVSSAPLERPKPVEAEPLDGFRHLGTQLLTGGAAAPLTRNPWQPAQRGRLFQGTF